MQPAPLLEGLSGVHKAGCYLLWLKGLGVANPNPELNPNPNPNASPYPIPNPDPIPNPNPTPNPYKGWISSFAEGKSLGLCVDQPAPTLTLTL